MQRDISRGSSSLVLRSEADKPVRRGPEATKEARLIRDHFGISLDNPTTILQQEQAKTFFANHSNEQMFNLIMEGTQIGVVKRDYLEAANQTEETEAKVKRRQGDLEKQRNRYRRES